MSTKKILCIRHGQSAYNAAFEATGIDPIIPDARLTPLGEQQVAVARETLRDTNVDLVITSPLTRALQTAVGIFGSHKSNPRFLVEALHRERVESSCDVGRSPALLFAEYPGLDFAHLAEVWWHALGEPDWRGVHVEPLDSMMDRISKFREFLSARPERSIAVIGHGTFFHQLVGVSFANCAIIELELEPEPA
jgi:broad specificity phosphatase PhoE